MLHGHLPFLISRLVTVARHVTHFYHNAARIIELGFYSIRSARPPEPWQRRRFSPNQRRGARRPLLIHYHIFKNAGTSFEWSLQQVFGTAVHKFDSPSPDGMITPEELASYVGSVPEIKVISSHQAILPAPRIPNRAVITSILIRNPIARVRSIYAFERRQTRPTLGALKAKELDFRGYVEWRLSCSPAMFCNYQVIFCSRTKDTPHDEELTEAHLENAVRNLGLIDIVGTVERYREWLVLAQSSLAGLFPNISLSYVRRNVSEQAMNTTHEAVLADLRRELGADLARRLLECNDLDMRLHQFADASLTRRLVENTTEVA